MSVRGIFIERLAAFLARYRVGRSEFGALALKDRWFVRNVEKGAPVTLGRIETAEEFMARVAANPAVLDDLRKAAGISRRQPAGEDLGVGGNP